MYGDGNRLLMMGNNAVITKACVLRKTETQAFVMTGVTPHSSK